MHRIYNTSEINTSSFPLIPLRHKAVFPGAVMPLVIGRTRSLAMVEKLEGGQLIGFAIQRDPQMADPGVADLHPIGVLARVRRIMRTGDRRYRLLVEGVTRFRLSNLVKLHPYWMAEGELLAEPQVDGDEAILAVEVLIEQLQALLNEAGAPAQDISSDEAPGLVADRVAASLGLGLEEETLVLAALDPIERLRLVAELIGQVRARHEVKKSIETEVRRKLGKDQREHVLREQMRAIRKELGEDGDPEGEQDVLKKKLEEAGLPEDVQKVVDRELRRLGSINANQAEANVIRNYLELIADLPWSKRAEAVEDLGEVEAQLEADHFGLDEVKKRIMEHMAVLNLSGNPRGTILCFAGPPGVGKTSLGQSIADATNRPMMRISLGGVRDEAEIRGHRRTYVGALPGRILHALRKSKVKNPVILLDEIDKLSQGWAGSPEAALLEVLDPEQNKNFLDHYLELPFDLSEVMFICTANDLGKLSAPLRDRLEIIKIEGYTPTEKSQIARRHLLPRRLSEYAIPDESLIVTDTALTSVIRDYTREAGVRQLDRELTKICRALALQVARGGELEAARTLDTEDLRGYLGKPKFFSEVAERTATPGVATGLAWTPVGGDILFIETSMMPGKGRLEITGQLGDVMKESARAALTYVRSHADGLEVDPDFLESLDLHIHVPAGAVPKDGPSAGVTIFTALTSLLTGRKVRSDTAMTGECTLRGRVLPVGGIKAKVMAAHRSGLTRVILPKRNANDLDEVPEEIREAMEFFPVDDMSEALGLALEPDTVSSGIEVKVQDGAQVQSDAVA